MTKKKQGQNRTKLISVLSTIIASLITAVVVQGFMLSTRSNDIERDSYRETGSIVSLGAIEYDFANGKAVKRDDPRLKALRSFLTAEGSKSVNSNCNVVYHNVVAASPNNRQVLLSYGCEHPGSPMFAVDSESGWKLLSPTNQFDLFGIPSCEHVDSNKIDRSIAPVCVNQPAPGSNELSYIAR